MALNDYFSVDITPYTQPIAFAAGDTITPEGEELDCLYFIEQGTAKCLETQENGTVHLIFFLNAPSFIGDLELVGARQRANGVVAVTDCSGYMIRLSQCRELILNDVTFLRYLCVNFAKKTVRNARNLYLGLGYPLKNRLATLMCDMQSHGLYTLPHTEAAAYLGVSYRHFLYVLKEFQEAGWVQKTHAGYRIVDMEALEDLYIHRVE